MSEGYAYYIEVRYLEPGESPVDRPYALWRRSADGWTYWSAVGWEWRELTEEWRERTGRRAPDPEDMVAASAAQVEELTRDRWRWFRFWAVYRSSLPHDRDPITVIRLRSGWEPPFDEAYTRDHGWGWTDLLRRFESGYSSISLWMEPIDHAEAERIVRRRAVRA